MENQTYNIEHVYNHLPHRPPFIMVDKILSIKSGESAEGLKCVSVNEPYLAGHFPNYPIVPGVMLIEAIAQTGGFVFYDPDNKQIDGEFLLVGVDKAKFKQQVRPGDILIIRTLLTAEKMRLYFFSGTIHIRDINGNESLAMSAEIKMSLVKIAF